MHSSCVPSATRMRPGVHAIKLWHKENILRKPCRYRFDK